MLNDVESDSALSVGTILTLLPLPVQFSPIANISSAARRSPRQETAVSSLGRVRCKQIISCSTQHLGLWFSKLCTKCKCCCDSYYGHCDKSDEDIFFANQDYLKNGWWSAFVCLERNDRFMCKRCTRIHLCTHTMDEGRYIQWLSTDRKFFFFSSSTSTSTSYYMNVPPVVTVK